jgi:uncharacterized membrane protein YeaQ/YmgE (transglycosylase-associated protein family)
MGFIASIIIGVLAGWLAGQLMKGGGYGLWGDLILGLVGSIVGGWLSSLLLGVDLTSGFNLTTLITSVIGAVIVVAIYRLVTRRSLTG